MADRIELHTGDLTRLPFPDNTFDVVTASLAIHNIADAQGRAEVVGISDVRNVVLFVVLSSGAFRSCGGRTSRSWLLR